MSVRFTCPSCNKQYPFLPTLIGRQVRCSACHKGFTLGRDGIARALGEQPGEPSAGSIPLSNGQVADAERRSRAWAEQATVRLQQQRERTTTAKALPIQDRVASRRQARQRAAKANLRQAADDAARTVAAAPLQDTAPPQQAGNLKALEVKLQGSGARAGRRRRRLVAALVILVGGTVLAWSLRPQAGPRELLWLDYADALRSGRQPAMHWQRNNDGSRQPLFLTDPGAFTVGSAEHIDLTPVRPLLLSLQGHVLLKDLGLFCPQERSEELRAAYHVASARFFHPGRITQLQQAGFPLMTCGELADRIDAALRHDRAAWAVSALLCGDASRNGDGEAWRRLLLSGAIPDALTICQASGRQATAIVAHGKGWDTRAIARWVGVSMRIDHPLWPAGERVLSCQDVDNGHAETSPLRLLQRRVGHTQGLPPH